VALDNKDSDNKDSGNKDLDNKDSDNKDSDNKDSVNKDSVNKDSVNKDLDKDLDNQDLDNQDSVVKASRPVQAPTTPRYSSSAAPPLARAPLVSRLPARTGANCLKPSGEASSRAVTSAPTLSAPLLGPSAPSSAPVSPLPHAVSLTPSALDPLTSAASIGASTTRFARRLLASVDNLTTQGTS